MISLLPFISYIVLNFHLSYNTALVAHWLNKCLSLDTLTLGQKNQRAYCNKCSKQLDTDNFPTFLASMYYTVYISPPQTPAPQYLLDCMLWNGSLVILNPLHNEWLCKGCFSVLLFDYFLVGCARVSLNKLQKFTCLTTVWICLKWTKVAHLEEIN